MCYGSVDSPTDGPNITGVQFQLLTPTNVDPPVFQLTCISTSSPPTTVQWTINGSPVNGGNYASFVTDRPTSTYNNTLTVTGRTPGMYTCTVTTITNNCTTDMCKQMGLLTIRDPLPHPSVYQVSTTYEECLVPIDMYLYTGPPAPLTGVMAVQSGPTSVNVSWTAPNSGGPVSRYDIYYVTNGVPNTSGGSTTSTSYVLTNLQVGVQYNISVIAVGTYMPSQSGMFYYPCWLAEENVNVMAG